MSGARISFLGVKNMSAELIESLKKDVHLLTNKMTGVIGYLEINQCREALKEARSATVILKRIIRELISLAEKAA